MSTLELKNVSFMYSKGTPFEKEALDDVSYTFRDGAITGIVGHTGSGKSTMVELLCGLIKPSEGTVLLDGCDINLSRSEMIKEGLKAQNIKKSFVKKLFSSSYKEALAEATKKADAYRRDVRFAVGLVMQYPEYQLFDDTVISDIGFGPRNMGYTEEQVKVMSESAAGFVGVEPKLFTVSPFDLSGGEKRRVAVAGVLSMEPKILILDEPAAGLDPRGQKLVYDVIRRYKKKTGSTVIVVSHSMEDLATYCDDVVVLSHSKIIAHGTVGEIMGHPDLLTDAGLDIPQISYIAQKIISAGIPLRGELYTVDGVKRAILSYMKGGQ